MSKVDTESQITLETDLSPALPFNETERLERDQKNIISSLKITNGRISGPDGAAKLLGIKPTTLASRIKKLGIQQKDL